MRMSSAERETFPKFESQPRPRAKPVIRKPTSGKPAAITMSSLILPSPEAVLKLDGMPMRAVFQSVGKESMFKGMERVMKLNPKKLPKKLSADFAAMLVEMPASPSRSVMIRAIEGDEAALKEVNAMGLWAAYLAGVEDFYSPRRLLPIQHFSEVELASKMADSLLAKLDFESLAAECGRNASLRLYLNEMAISELASASARVDTDLPRVAGLLEFMLSQVARMDVSTRVFRGAGTSDGFAGLLRDQAEGASSPGREYMIWLRGALGVSKTAELLDLDAASSTPVIDESTLKRWSNGSEFPTEAKLSRFLSSVLKTQGAGNDAAKLLLAGEHYRAARRLDQLLNLARKIGANAHALGTQGRWVGVVGSSSADEWARSRYEKWMRHWEKFAHPLAPAMPLSLSA